MVIIVAQVFNCPIFIFNFNFKQQINILLLFSVIVINISKFLQLALEGVYVQELNIKWQPIGETRFL
jgi:hypothetical protein